MERKPKYHKPLPHSFDEVLENVAKGKGIEKRGGNKKHPEKSERKDKN